MNKWKMTAIIFIVLFCLETVIFLNLIRVGTNEIAKEDTCSHTVCYEYARYYYDDAIGTCTCYDMNGTATHKERI